MSHAAAQLPAKLNPQGLSAAAWHRLYADDLGRLAFYRTEDRTSSRSRTLDCHHTIGRGDPYRYSVSKTRGVAGLNQAAVCDVCRRDNDKY